MDRQPAHGRLKRLAVGYHDRMDASRRQVKAAGNSPVAERLMGRRDRSDSMAAGAARLD
jgi:hypothetical protein